MSVSNATAIDLALDSKKVAHSELRTLGAFLALYMTLVLLILALLGYFYVAFVKNNHLYTWRIELQKESQLFVSQLKTLHENFPHQTRYPRHIKSAIYDIEEALIFSTLDHTEVSLHEVIRLHKGTIQAVFQPENYYLGAAFIVLEVPDSKEWLYDALQKVLLWGSVALGIFSLLGWVLAKLFLRPMRQAIVLLDRFIKDTTHELNTPIATILANIETLSPDAANAKKIRRIEIAARTISVLYEDLTFLVLGGHTRLTQASIDCTKLLEERLEYFALAIEQKKLHLHKELFPHVIHQGDLKTFARLFDNLLSNAIKYNKPSGSIDVTLTPTQLSISDTGYGIEADQVDKIFQRYMRATTLSGGFGIGLHIVAKIAKIYGISIAVHSQIHQGTRITLTWQK